MLMVWEGKVLEIADFKAAEFLVGKIRLSFQASFGTSTFCNKLFHDFFSFILY